MLLFLQLLSLQELTLQLQADPEGLSGMVALLMLQATGPSVQLRSVQLNPPAGSGRP